MQEISLLLSIVALSFSLYVYIAFDRRLKRQSIELNELALMKIKNDEWLRKSARISVSTKQDSSGYILVITNSGQSTARDVFVACTPNVISGAIFTGPSLRPGQTVEQSLSIGMMAQGFLNVETEWNDGNGHHKEMDVAYL